MEKLKIAVMAGGNSTEREISIKSARYVMGELNREIYDVTLVFVNGTDWVAENDGGETFTVDKGSFSFTEKGVVKKFGFAIILIHGTPGENGLLQAYFDLMGIPYSTSGLLSSALTFDKALTKTLASLDGVKTAVDIVIKKGEMVNAREIIARLGLPLFIKPVAAGSSFGISKVKKKEEVLSAVQKAWEECDRVIIEEFIEGREVSCGIFKTREKEFVLPVTEIISENEYFDYEAKYLGRSQEVTPADIPQVMQVRLTEECRRIYKALLCEGVVRIDFILRGDVPYMIEVNSVPGMSPQSIIPQQLAAMGMTTSEMYNLIINDKLEKK